jgi:hypothetical protein
MECEFLEDSLRRYGVFAEYWPKPTATEIAQSMTSMEDVALASPNWRDELGEVVGARDHLPLFVGLGDVRLKTGLTDSALKAYAFAVSDESEPAALCELGSLLFDRCRTDERPLSERDFDGWFVNFDGKNDLPIVSYTGHDSDRERLEFPDPASIASLAVNAFGRAYVLSAASRFTDEGPATSTLWCELLALEGLRAGFMAVDDVAALQAAVAYFLGWIEDYHRREDEWWEGRKWLTVMAATLAKAKGWTLKVQDGGEWDVDPDDAVYAFNKRFSRVESYLRGRLKAATLTATGENQSTELALGQMTELLRASDRRMDNLVEKVIDIEQRIDLTWGAVSQLARVRPPAERAYVEGELRAGLGAVWESLDPLTRGELVDAEVLVAECQRQGSGWRNVALGYAVAIERELKITLDRMRKEVLHTTASRRSETLGQLMHSLGEYTKIGPKSLSANVRSLVQGGYNSLLSELNEIRIKTAHSGVEPVGRSDVQRAKSLLFERQGSHDKPLLVAVVEAREPRTEDV